MSFTKNTLIRNKLHKQFKKNWSMEKTEIELKKELSKKYFRVKENKKEEYIHLFARKKTIGLFGSDIVHLGLLIILIGGIISGLGGFRANTKISEGQIVPVLKANFKLRLDKFETEYYPNGSVKDWKSTLTVLENKKPVLTKTIEVNHPLSYKGYMFYQNSYGWDWTNPLLEIWIKKQEDPSYLEKIEIKLGEAADRKNDDLEISILRFVPDFILNEKRQVTTRSLEPNNPAAFVEAHKSGKKIFSGWIFAKFPDFSRTHEKRKTDLILELKDVKAAQYSGLQVSKDPGVNFIWIGCAALMIGLCLAFYWPTKEVLVILEAGPGRTEITAAGRAAKSKTSFQAEFEEILASLRKSK
jgi:cytochrome c biogenesis protein